MIAIWRFVWLVLCIVSIGIAVPVLFSGSLRSDYAFVINRKIASIWPPKYAFVGNSLTAGCNWRWELGSLSVVNLATGGAVIREVTHQLTQVLPLKPRFLFIEAGINDVVTESSPIERIAYDFDYLLRQLPSNQKAIVTLIPLVSSHSLTDKIVAANSVIASHVENRGLSIIDLNPLIATQGVRYPEMTTDGIHFTHKACAVWVDEIRQIIEAGAISSDN